MDILGHHIYEYKRGVRSLMLRTLDIINLDLAIERIVRDGIFYHVLPVTDKKVNIFFGDKICVDIVVGFGDKALHEYSHEQDFILGIMLGYSRVEQCKRYIKRIHRGVQDTTTKSLFQERAELTPKFMVLQQ